MLAVSMPVGADRYALPMPAVREVVSLPPVTPVPTAPASVLGLFNLRGEIVPLFDTAVLLGVGRSDGAGFCVVTLTALGPAGLTATGVPETVELADPIGGAEVTAGVASYAVDGRVAVLLDIDALLTPAHIGGWAA